MTTPLWLTALALTTFLQMAGSFMSQCLPVIGPLLTASIGIEAVSIGLFSALTSLGSVVFLALGTPFVVRFGPVRALQASVMCGACALMVVSIGVWPAAAAAAWLLGLAYGPVPPGTTRLLGATAPARHRGLIFSIKQAGAQLGGVLAGLLLAPIAARFGWQVALAVSASVGFAAGLCVFPFRKKLDIGRDPSRALFRLDNLRAPFAAIAADSQLLALTALTTAFAVAQGCLFSFCVTYLTVTHHFGLVEAGLAYAFMQGGAMSGRVLLGFLADRSGNAMRNLLGQALACSVLILVWSYVPIPPGAAGVPWVVRGLAFLVGIMAASWNGLVLAEIARLAPPERMADAAAGSTMISFCGYVVGPALFSLGVRGFGEWQTPYLLVALQLAAMALALPVWLRRRARPSLSPVDHPIIPVPATKDSAR